MNQPESIEEYTQDKTQKSHKVTTSVSEHGYPMITVNSLREIHKITFELDPQRSQALVNSMDIEYHSPVELVMMLNYACDLLNQSNIKQILQQVTHDDWDNVLKSDKLFKKIISNDDFVTVSCDINNFSESVMKALGFEALPSAK